MSVEKPATTARSNSIDIKLRRLEDHYLISQNKAWQAYLPLS